MGRQPRSSGWIYFVRVTEHTKPIKIGRADSLSQRLSNLQAGMPWEIEMLLAVVDHGGYEKALHRHFEHLWMRGEWFRAGDSILDLIADLRGNAGDILTVGGQYVPEFSGDISRWLNPIGTATLTEIDRTNSYMTPEEKVRLGESIRARANPSKTRFRMPAKTPKYKRKHKFRAAAPE